MRVTAKELLKTLVAIAEDSKKYVAVDEDSWNDIQIITPIMKFQMTNLAEWCKRLGKKYKREDWDGNEQCGSNWDIIYFKYQGVEFFELVDKENKDETN